jgi:arginine deiminase
MLYNFWVCGFTCGFFIHLDTPFIALHVDLVVVYNHMLDYIGRVGRASKDSP